MSSASLRRWQSTRRLELDRIAAAHGAVGGSGPGRRWSTLQINQAYAVLLPAQFQGFCRDLHSEAVAHIVRSVTPAALHEALRTEFALGRKLDRGNPNPGNIGADFTRLGLSFWDRVQRINERNEGRQSKLVELSDWRNAIAHQDFDRGKLQPASLTLRVTTRWHNACNGLALSFDRVIGGYIASITSAAPW